MEEEDNIAAAEQAADLLTPVPMSGLPDEMVRRVLSFLPIDFVLSAMSVDKKWEQAARYEVKHWKKLWIFGRKRCAECKTVATSCQSCRKRFSDEGDICMDTRNDHPVHNFILKMQRLEELYLYNDPVELPALFIPQNGKTLRLVSGVFRLPVVTGIVYERLEELLCSDVDEETVTACPNLMVLKLDDRLDVTREDKRVLQKPLPSVLFPKLVHFKSDWECVREASDFIALHAHQLKKMRCYGMYPLEFNGREVIYTRLEKATVDLYKEEEDSVSVLRNCPKLQRLKVICFDDDADLSHLPVDCMRSLTISFRDNGVVTEKSFEHLVTSVSRLKNLTLFRITCSPFDAELLTGKNRKNYDILVPLFDEVHELEDVTLSVTNGVVEMDLLIDRLVRGNPFLETLDLSDIQVTDSVVESMSRLSHLQTLTCCVSYGKTTNLFTTNSLVKLMTGPSGASLENLKVRGTKDVDFNQVEEAFVLMLAKRGLTPNHQDWKKDVEGNNFCFSC